MYQVNENRFIAFFPVIVLGIMLGNNLWNIGVWSAVIILSVLALPVLIQYRVRIDCGMVHYDIRFLRIPLHRRIIAPESIEQICFNRYDWRKRGAVLKLTNGRKVRLTHFDSVELMGRLETFAKTYKVPVNKSKDYKLLERMDASKKRPQY